MCPLAGIRPFAVSGSLTAILVPILGILSPALALEKPYPRVGAVPGEDPGFVSSSITTLIAGVSRSSKYG